MVDHCGTYGLHFTFSKGCHHCHAAFKDIIKRALDATKISIHLETTGLYQSNGKQAYRASIVPWRWESAGVGCHLLRTSLQATSSPHTSIHGIYRPAASEAAQEGHDGPPPSGQASHCQKVWETPKICAS